MCLRIKDKNYLIAEEDKTVYKVLMLNSQDNSLLSPYTGFAYTLGKTYNVNENEFTDIKLADFDLNPLYAVLYEFYPYQSLYGFHSYPDNEYRECVSLSCWLESPCSFNSKPVVVECLIPKGSKYYLGLNETGIEVTPVLGVVSNKIKPIKIIDTKNGCN